MITYKAPVEDILFSLEHVARADSLKDFDIDTHREIAVHFATFAEGVLAPLNGPGDREGASLVNGRVYMPSGFKAAYDQFCAQGWPGLMKATYWRKRLSAPSRLEQNKKNDTYSRMCRLGFLLLSVITQPLPLSLGYVVGLRPYL